MPEKVMPSKSIGTDIKAAVSILSNTAERIEPGIEKKQKCMSDLVKLAESLFTLI